MLRSSSGPPWSRAAGQQHLACCVPRRASTIARSASLLVLACLLCCATGCRWFPEITRQPTFHNPFPQLSKVAVVPFFNLSAEPTVDGRQFALAYANELQSIPGFEVLSVGVVERKIKDYKLALSSPSEVRKLAQLLEVDAVVIGVVTDYTPYYPPRCGMQVEWYAANPGFHPIPPGYGLPWGRPEEEYIPQSLVFESEMALARAQLKTQTPYYEPEPVEEPQQKKTPPGEDHPLPPGSGRLPEQPGKPRAKLASQEEIAPPAGATDTTAPSGTLPPDWPDPRGFVPPAPQPQRPPLVPSCDPVLTHFRIYNGSDGDFTAALQRYVYFRDDARFGGWQSYLQRSDDFIRFCCYMNIVEMLSARGGAGETRVVWRWPANR
jgi:hypothetical protein